MCEAQALLLLPIAACLMEKNDNGEMFGTKHWMGERGSAPTKLLTRKEGLHLPNVL